MRITEELWNKKAFGFSNFNCDADYIDEKNHLIYLKGVFKRIVGKEAFSIFPHPTAIRGNESEKGESQLSTLNYILKVNSFFTRS